MELSDLRDWREHKGLTLGKAADFFGVSLQNYYHHECKFPRGRVDRIADYGWDIAAWFVIPRDEAPGFCRTPPPYKMWRDLKEYRKYLGLSLEKADELCAMAKGSFRQIEARWPNMNASTAVAISEGYGVDLWFSMAGIGFIDDPLVPCPEPTARTK